MARIRSIKPEFWDDRKLAKRTSRDARLLYIALWNLADEWGRVNGDPQWIKGQVFSYDDDLDADSIAKLLEELENPALGAVVAYEVEGDPYLFLPKLGKHQRLEPEKVKSRLPDPPGPDSPGPGRPPSERDADWSESRADLSERGADETARGADQSEPGADSSALLYVAGGREHVAGGRVAHTGARDAPPKSVLANSLLQEHTRQITPPPPRDTTRRTGEQIDLLLDDREISPEDVRGGLALLRVKPGLGPGVLPSLVHEFRQKQAHPELAAQPFADRRQQATDAQFARAAQRLAAREARGNDPA